MSGATGNDAHHGVTRLAVTMLLLAMAAASVVAWAALRTPATSLLARRGETVPPASIGSTASAITPALIERGAALAGMQCAGCHDADHRLVGPSWTAIGRRYASMAKLDPICGDGRGLIGDGASHPEPGWDGYPPGPTNIELSPDDRTAIAAWVLSVAQGAVK